MSDEHVVLQEPSSPSGVDTAPLAVRSRGYWATVSERLRGDKVALGFGLVNMARGGCVDQSALIEALRNGAIAGAGLDTVVEEPLPAASPLWDFDNVIITPHTGGETRQYENNVIDVLLDNLDRLWRGESELRNQVV